MSPENTCENKADKVRDLIAGWIDAVTSQGERAIDAIGLRTGSKTFIPNVDLVETDESVSVLVDLPGVDPERVEILLAGNMLTVKGERPVPASGSSDTVHRRERPSGAFYRSLPLPVAVDPERVRAEAHGGVLTIKLSKSEKVKARHIHVGTGHPENI